MDAGSFPTTIWSEVRRGGAHAAGRDSALAGLARRYQGPAEAYLCAALGLERERAHELFQEFFAWMLAGDFLAKAAPERGRFRGFLKVALKRFATDELRKAAAAKRGGGQATVALDAEGAPELADRAQPSPEDALDRAWRAELVEAAFERTRLELERRERGLAFAVFRDYYLAPGPESDYRALAARHGLSTADVSNHLQRTKLLFREQLRALVLDTVANAEDLGDELAWLVAEDERMSSELSPEARARLLADAHELATDAGALLHGRYRLVRELGRGGMGVVYEAEDVALRRRVAVKRLNLPADVGPGLAEQVLREARAAARLDHPGIAAVYDAHADAIVMQFVDGKPLSELDQPPVRELVGWMRDAARAVQHAHEHGIVHRDLKPHNLMIAGARVVVTDFGLAKELAVDTSLSLSGSVLGTPSYMPPEQAGGRAREVDARSDVYALGATLYDRLAGRPPFVAKDLVALLRAVVEDEPVPVQALAPGVPRDLALVVHKCLEKDKARRYASAAELADDLERWLEGRAVLAKPPTLRYRLMKNLRRHRVLVGAASLLALLALGAVAWNWSERAQRAAVEETLVVVDDLNAHLDNARVLGAGEGQSAARERLDPAIAQARAFLARHPEAYQIEVKLGELLRERQQYGEALLAFERALALRPDYDAARLQRGIQQSRLVGERRAAGESSPALEELRAQARADLTLGLGSASALREIDVRIARAELARLEDRPDEALRRYDDVNRLGQQLETPPALAALALAQGDPDEAFRQAMSAVDLARGFAPAYVAQSTPDTPEEAAARATRQHQRSAAGAEATLEIEGIPGRFTDWALRLAEKKSTSGAYALRATGELRRAARLVAEARTAEALAALDKAVEDLGFALTIEPELAPALCDRALVELARARLLVLLERVEDARLARARGRADLDRAGQAGNQDAVKSARELFDSLESE